MLTVPVLAALLTAPPGEAAVRELGGESGLAGYEFFGESLDRRDVRDDGTVITRGSRHELISVPYDFVPQLVRHAAVVFAVTGRPSFSQRASEPTADGAIAWKSEARSARLEYRVRKLVPPCAGGFARGTEPLGPRAHTTFWMVRFGLPTTLASALALACHSTTASPPPSHPDTSRTRSSAARTAPKVSLRNGPTTVPFRRVGGLLYVDAVVDGMDTPVSLVVDTGASMGVLSRAIADQLGLRLTAPQPVEGVASRTQLQAAMAPGLRVGGLRIGPGWVYVMEAREERHLRMASSPLWPDCA